MVYSNDDHFQLIFIDPFRRAYGKNIIYKHIMTPEGICLIGENDLKKQIRRIWIESQKRTFKQRCKILGFPQGNGNFSCFKFHRPNIDMNKVQKEFTESVIDLVNDKDNDLNDYQGGPGEIIVKIYLTRQVPRREEQHHNQDLHPYEQFQPICFPKKYQSSLGICQGEIIQRQTNQFFQHERPMEVIRDIVLYDSLVQSFRIVYRDIQYVIDKGYIKLSNHNDLPYLTCNYLSLTNYHSQRSKRYRNTILERFSYYCQNVYLLKLFLTNDDLQKVDKKLRKRVLKQCLINFLDSEPLYFRKIDEGTYGLTEKFELNSYNIKCEQQQKQMQQQQQQIWPKLEVIHIDELTMDFEEKDLKIIQMDDDDQFDIILN